MALADDLDDAFRTLYVQLDEEQPCIPAIEEGDVLLYDVQGYGDGVGGEKPWAAPGNDRPDRDAVRDAYDELLDGYQFVDVGNREHYTAQFPEAADEVFRDRIYCPPENLHAVLDIALREDALQPVVERLHGYENATDADISVAGEPVRDVAEGGIMPHHYHEPVYGDLARRIDDAAFPGETMLMPVQIAHPDDRGEDPAGHQDDHLYLLVMEDDRRDGYPVLFFNGLLTEEKRDAAADVARLLDEAV